MATKKLAKKKTPPKTTAWHAEDGTHMHHVVGIGNLRVILVPDGDFWFAQGLEIDYAAQGKSKPDAKRKFENGLLSTIQQHLKIHGSIEKLLKIAPPAVWKEFLYDPAGQANFYSQVSAHTIDALPFGGIEYIQQGDAA